MFALLKLENYSLGKILILVMEKYSELPFNLFASSPMLGLLKVTVTKSLEKCSDYLNYESITNVLSENLLKHEVFASLLANFYRYQWESQQLKSALQNPFSVMRRTVSSLTYFSSATGEGDDDDEHCENPFCEDSWILLTVPTTGNRYSVYLSGDPRNSKSILLLHSYLSDPMQDFFNNSVVKHLRRKFRCIAIAQPGCDGIVDHVSFPASGSKVLKPSGVTDERSIVEIQMSDYVNIMSIFGYEKFATFGFDTGAAYAWILALLHPENISSLVTLCSPHPLVELQMMRKKFSLYWYYYLFLLNDVSEQIISKCQKDLRVVETKVISPSTSQSNTSTASSSNSLQEHGDQNDEIPRPKQDWNPETLKKHQDIYRNLLQFYFQNSSKIEQKASLKIPTAILWGSEEGELHDPESYFASLSYCTSSLKKVQELNFSRSSFVTSLTSAEIVASEIETFVLKAYRM